jgi:integrase
MKRCRERLARRRNQIRPQLRHVRFIRNRGTGARRDDTFVLKKLAGHANISTTLRYIHMNDAHAKAEMKRVLKVQGTHISPHGEKTAETGDRDKIT